MGAAVGLGVVIGVLLGLLGAGGSILAVPALVYGAGQPLSAAVPTSLLVVGISAATAVGPRILARQVQWRIAAVVGAAGVPSAFAGTAVNRQLDPRVVLLGFAVVMVAAALRMLREQPDIGGDCALPGGGVNWRGCLPKAVGTGAVVGFLTGLFGVGGGFVIVPALALALKLPMPEAIGTSLLVIAINAGVALTARLATTTIDWDTTLPFGVAAVAGVLAGGRVAGRLDPRRSLRWFSALLVVVALYTATRATTDLLT